ncbi:linear amide C-N hydrolase [Aporhodopirellula aestuarii]|uniref:Linear amide C-N hydrolase n=1 Tax=Aporhodopirellula aestuarii TaxID=2950107 RepID=A0ABT0U345_9BACT|nr:linear amide C-N hydrolase [Aporhodopirellula aestuarii]MCM2371314.1 linear amide C-N hydrolase [Aporhodopirellula aestuarii]
MRRFLCIGLILAVAAVAHPAAACTVMRMKLADQLIVARNHDWGTGGGLLIVNPRGIEKTAITPVNPAKWVSRYGSVSFAQFGREIPFAGMNEKGLTVDLLQLGDAAFPNAGDDTASVNVVQWVQYQLDMSASVADVIESLDVITPTPFIAMLEKVHYFVTDASGDVAIIEYLDGKPIVQHDPVTACILANSTWERSWQACERERPTNGSERRFMQAKLLSQTKDSDAPVNDAIAALHRVAQSHTQWNLVYEPERLRISFRTRVAPKLRRIDLKELQFEENAEVLCVDINADHEGDVQQHLQQFTREANSRIVDDAFDAILPAGLVRSTIKQMVLNYGEALEPALIK